MPLFLYSCMRYPARRPPFTELAYGRRQLETLDSRNCAFMPMRPEGRAGMRPQGDG